MIHFRPIFDTLEASNHHLITPSSQDLPPVERGLERLRVCRNGERSRSRVHWVMGVWEMIPSLHTLSLSGSVGVVSRESDRGSVSVRGISLDSEESGGCSRG